MFCVCVYIERIFSFCINLSVPFIAIISNLFDLVLYVHSKQLRSCQEVQLLNQIVSAQTEAVYQYIAQIF